MQLDDLKRLRRKNEKYKALLWEHYSTFKSYLMQMEANNQELEWAIFEEKQRRAEIIDQYTKKISILESELRQLNSIYSQPRHTRKVDMSKYNFGELEDEGRFIMTEAESVFERHRKARDLLKPRVKQAQPLEQNKPEQEESISEEANTSDAKLFGLMDAAAMSSAEGQKEDEHEQEIFVFSDNEQLPVLSEASESDGKELEESLTESDNYSPKEKQPSKDSGSYYSLVVGQSTTTSTEKTTSQNTGSYQTSKDGSKTTYSSKPDSVDSPYSTPRTEVAAEEESEYSGRADSEYSEPKRNIAEEYDSTYSAPKTERTEEYYSHDSEPKTERTEEYYSNDSAPKTERTEEYDSHDSEHKTEQTEDSTSKKEIPSKTDSTYDSSRQNQTETTGHDSNEKTEEYDSYPNTEYTKDGTESGEPQYDTYSARTGRNDEDDSYYYYEEEEEEEEEDMDAQTTRPNQTLTPENRQNMTKSTSPLTSSDLIGTGSPNQYLTSNRTSSYDYSRTNPSKDQTHESYSVGVSSNSGEYYDD